MLDAPWGAGLAQRRVIPLMLTQPIWCYVRWRRVAAHGNYTSVNLVQLQRKFFAPTPVGFCMQMKRILMMRLLGGVFLVAALMGFAPAWADRPAADRCASALPAASKTMYNEAVPAVVAGTAVADALRAVARPMVMNGSMTRDQARAAAEAAAACLAQAK